MHDVPTTQQATATFARFKEAALAGKTEEASSRFNFAAIFHGLERPQAIKMAIEATTEIRFHTEMTEEAMVKSALNGPSPLSVEVGKAIQRSMDIKNDPSLALEGKVSSKAPEADQRFELDGTPCAAPQPLGPEDYAELLKGMDITLAPRTAKGPGLEI